MALEFSPSRNDPIKYLECNWSGRSENGGSAVLNLLYKLCMITVFRYKIIQIDCDIVDQLPVFSMQKVFEQKMGAPWDSVSAIYRFQRSS
jgi:hypothetical protein